MRSFHRCRTGMLTLLALTVFILSLLPFSSIAEQQIIKFRADKLFPFIEVCDPDAGLIEQNPILKYVNVVHEDVKEDSRIHAGIHYEPPIDPENTRYILHFSIDGTFLGMDRNPTGRVIPTDTAYLNNTQALTDAALKATEKYLAFFTDRQETQQFVKSVSINTNANAFFLDEFPKDDPFSNATRHNVTITIEFPVNTAVFAQGQTVELVWEPIYDRIMSWSIAE